MFPFDPDHEEVFMNLEDAELHAPLETEGLPLCRQATNPRSVRQDAEGLPLFVIKKRIPALYCT